MSVTAGADGVALGATFTVFEAPPVPREDHYGLYLAQARVLGQRTAELHRALATPTFAERLRSSDEASRLFVRLCTTVQRTKLRGGRPAS